MSDMYDFLKTVHRIQQIVDPLQPILKQTQQIMEPLQPILDQTRQIQKLGATVESSLGIVDRMGISQIPNPTQQGVLSNLVSCNNNLSYILQVQAETKEIQELQRGILGNGALTAVNEYVQKINVNWKNMMGLTDIVQRSMQAQNIAMLRLIPNFPQYELPYGVKTVVRRLSKNAAKRIAEADEILFDTEDRKFYHEDEPEVKVDAKSITVMESSIELFADITLTQLIQFESRLYENKAFAIKHPVGQHIYEIIQNWNDFIDFDCDVYYHARPMTSNPYLEYEMLKAPMNVCSSHGRYNDIGNSCYYFTDQRNGAVNEIRKHSGGKNPKIQVAAIKPVKSIKMIDLSMANLSKRNNFIDHIRQAVSNNSSVIKKEYLLPNFVASCCKEVGIEGIKYYSSGYNCYVTWKDDYFAFESHEIVDPMEKGA